jgi:hypothetical protein
MKSKRLRIMEMPRRVSPDDPDLGFSTELTNTQLATEILKSSDAVLIETSALGNKLFRVRNKFALVDPHRVRLLYYMSWVDCYYKFLNITVAQEVFHWKDRGVFENRNLTAHVYFDLLLPVNQVIMTDSEHTGPGEGFWLKAIDEAFDRGLNIYYINFMQTPQHSTRKIVKIKDKFEFTGLLVDPINIHQRPWGYEMKFEGRRILISERIL